MDNRYSLIKYNRSFLRKHPSENLSIVKSVVSIQAEKWELFWHRPWIQSTLKVRQWGIATTKTYHFYCQVCGLYRCNKDSSGMTLFTSWGEAQTAHRLCRVFSLCFSFPEALFFQCLELGCLRHPFTGEELRAGYSVVVMPSEKFLLSRPSSRVRFWKILFSGPTCPWHRLQCFSYGKAHLGVQIRLYLEKLWFAVLPLWLLLDSSDCRPNLLKPHLQFLVYENQKCSCLSNWSPLVVGSLLSSIWPAPNSHSSPPLDVVLLSPTWSYTSYSLLLLDN